MFNEGDLICLPEVDVKLHGPRLTGSVHIRAWNTEKDGDDTRLWNSDDLEFMLGKLAAKLGASYDTCAAWKADGAHHADANYVARPAYWPADAKLGVYEVKQDAGFTAVGCLDRSGGPLFVRIARKTGSLDGEQPRIARAVLDQIAHGPAQLAEPKWVAVSEPTLKLAAKIPEGWDVLWGRDQFVIQRNASVVAVAAFKRNKDHTLDQELTELGINAPWPRQTTSGGWLCSQGIVQIDKPISVAARRLDCVRESGDFVVHLVTIGTPVLDVAALLSIGDSLSGFGKVTADTRDNRKKPVVLTKRGIPGTPLSVLAPTGWGVEMETVERPMIRLTAPGLGNDLVAIDLLNSKIGSDGGDYKNDLADDTTATTTGAWRCKPAGDGRHTTCVRPLKTTPKILLRVLGQGTDAAGLNFVARSLTKIGDSIDTTKLLEVAPVARGDAWGRDSP